MLMVANVGNSIISVGFFEDNECNLISSFKISSDIKRTSDEYLSVLKSICSDKGIECNDISGAIISSVVPQLTQKIAYTVESFCQKEPLIVGPGVKTGFQIKIDSPSELGGDMVANTAAVMRTRSVEKCVIVADVGTVNTVSAINKNGEYIGCTIFPGLQMSFDALHGETAQLPNVNVSSAVKAIGRNSQSAICSGVLLGTALSLDGFVEKFADEMNSKPEKIELVATGEYAPNVIKMCKYDFKYESDLTLKGLYYLYKNTTKS